MKTFLVIGVGGLGCPLALALRRAGRLVLVDDDVVDPTNLQRQILFRTDDVGRPKVEAARDALLRRGALAVDAVRAHFDEATAGALLHDADVVCDGSDNLATKFAVNDACLRVGRRFVVAAAIRHGGNVFPVIPRETPCWRCLFEGMPEGELEACADAGILGATCGQVAGLQAKAALALATGRDPEGLLGRMWLCERGEVRSIAFRRRPGCSGCDSPTLEVSE
ncbi:MAG TPA: ThiF family adenylyltransferase [Haliangiales bacterium]|nr:ThiF family adenylyltransferase [Haliangiales bacterium]